MTIWRGRRKNSAWPVEELVELIGISDYVWAFDIAIVPSHLLSFYSDVPSEFLKQIVQEKHLYISHEL